MMRRGRLRWRGHVERKDDADYVNLKAYTRLVVEGKTPVGRPGKPWQNTLSADMRRSAKIPRLKVDTRDVHDRKKWRVLGWCRANPSASGTPT